MSEIKKIIRLYVFLGLIALAIPTSSLFSHESIYSDESYNFLVKPVQAENITLSPKAYSACDGIWIEGYNYLRQNLQVLKLSNWRAETKPSIIEETRKSENTVIIGHNICLNGDCLQSRSNFSNIINLKEGDEMRMCDGQNYYSGKILQSKPISEKDTYVLDSWTGFPSVTMFTSYGKCKDSECSSTEQRWLIVFAKN